MVARGSRVVRSFLAPARLQQFGSAALGFGATELADQFIPIPATSTAAIYGRKILAAAGAYMILSFLIKSGPNRQAIAIGAGLNVVVDALKDVVPDIASKFGFSGYYGYGSEALTGGENLPDRMTPGLAVPTLAS